MEEKDLGSRILSLLATSREGMTITDVASRLKINRNSVSKHMGILEAKGRVEGHSFGSAKVFFAARRIPASVLIDHSSDLVCAIDESGVFVFANTKFLSFFQLENTEVRGRRLDGIPAGTKGNPHLSEVFSGILHKEASRGELSLQKQQEGRIKTFHFRTQRIPTRFEDGTGGETVFLEDVTVERNHLKGLEFLARTSARLADMGEEENIYQYIADRIAELVPESVIGVLSFHPETMASYLQGLSGDRDLVEGLLNGLEIDPGNVSFSFENVPRAIPFLRTGLLGTAGVDLYEQMLGMYPKDLCDRIQERLSLGSYYTVGCNCRGGLYGCVVILLKKGAELAYRDTVQAFVRQAGVSLQRKHMRERLAIVEEQLKELRRMWTAEGSPRPSGEKPREGRD
ncbi:MAG: hypothetical protein LUQ01_00930 [Methanolinea sp.]|nr:hypothetical protein [Methanolinea sp.]